MYPAPHQESPACRDKNGNQLQVVARGSQDCFMPLTDWPSPWMPASRCTFDLSYIRITVRTLDPSTETKAPWERDFSIQLRREVSCWVLMDSHGIHCINHNNSNEQGPKSYLPIREAIMATQSFLESCLELELQWEANSKFGKFHPDLQLVIPGKLFSRPGWSCLVRNTA